MSGEGLTPEEVQELADLKELETLKAEEVADAAQQSAPPALPQAVVPDGTTSPQTSTLDKILRSAEFASRGVVDNIAEYAALPAEGVAAWARGVNMKEAQGGKYGDQQDKLKGLLREGGKWLSTPVNAVTDFGPDAPQSTLERGSYGAGRGVVDAGAFMVPGGMAAKYAKAGSTLSNVGKAMTAQPGMQRAAAATGGAVQETTNNPWASLGAALSVPIGSKMAIGSLKRLRTPFVNQLNMNEQRLASIAQQMGIQLTPGQGTGSPALQTMESTLGQLPLTSGKQNAIYEGQRKAFNKAVLKQAGVEADNVSPEVMDKAFLNIGKEFDTLAAQTQVKITPQMTASFEDTAKNAARYLGADDTKKLLAYTDDFTQLHKQLAGNPIISGTEYQALSSRLKTAARSNAKNPDLQHALNSLATVLDDALEASGGSALRSAWGNVRNRYRNLLTIKAAATGGDAASGARADIPLAALRGAVKNTDKSGYARGRGDLNTAARVGQFLQSAIPPDSGTSRRTAMINMLTGGSSVGAGSAAAYAGGGPLAIGAAAAAPILGPKAAQLVYGLPQVQAYLRNQMVPGNGGKLTAELLGKVLATQEMENN